MRRAPCPAAARRRARALVASAVLGGACLAAPAHSQTLDYGAFEQLLGQPISMSATGLPSTVADVPENMVIITAEDIRRSGAADLPGVLQHIIGIDVLRTGATTAEVSVRGYNSPQTPRLLVLVNGRQVYIDIYGATVWAALPVALPEIRQIEVVKGPNSALFGFNAADGVINIVTWNPLHDDVRTAIVSAGNGGRASGSAVATVRLGDATALKIAASGLHDDDYVCDQEVERANQSAYVIHQGYASAALHRDIAGGELELEATHVNLGQTEFPIFAVPQYLHFNVDSFKAEYTAETVLGMVTARAYTNLTQLDSQILRLIHLGFYNPLRVAQLQDVVKLGPDHSIRVSAEYRGSEINTSPIGAAHVAYQIASLGLTWNWRALPWLTLTNAGRLDTLWLQRTGIVPLGLYSSNDPWNKMLRVPTFNSGAVVRLGAADTLRLSAAQGAVLPSLVEFGGLQLFYPPFAFGGQPAIQPTIVTNTEIDYDHAVPALAMTLRVAAFYETTRDVQVAVGPTRKVLGWLEVGLASNIGNSSEYGLELSASGDLPGHVHWSAGFSPRMVLDHFHPGMGVQRAGIDYQHTTPRQTAKIGLGWSDDRWEIDAFAQYQSLTHGVTAPLPTDYRLEPVPDYVSFDGRIAYRALRHVTVSLTGQNLGVQHQPQSVFTRVDRRVQANLELRF